MKKLLLFALLCIPAITQPMARFFMVPNLLKSSLFKTPLADNGEPSLSLLNIHQTPGTALSLHLKNIQLKVLQKTNLRSKILELFASDARKKGILSSLTPVGIGKSSYFLTRIKPQTRLWFWSTSSTKTTISIKFSLPLEEFVPVLGHELIHAKQWQNYEKKCEKTKPGDLKKKPTPLFEKSRNREHEADIIGLICAPLCPDCIRTGIEQRKKTIKELIKKKTRNKVISTIVSYAIIPELMNALKLLESLNLPDDTKRCILHGGTSTDFYRPWSEVKEIAEKILGPEKK